METWAIAHVCEVLASGLWYKSQITTAPQLISYIAKLELKLERQNKFASNKQKNSGPETKDAGSGAPVPNSSEAKQPKKKGAPVGYPG